MATRKTPFIVGEFYHVYNRGVDKRNIFSDEQDIDRFIQSMDMFNVLDPIGSIYEKTFENKRFGSKASKSEKLVNFIAYCLNPNHYHFILEPLVDKGIEKFMQRLGTGGTKYFNNKYKRSGALFQGKFKSIHIDSNEYLLHLSAYVNLNWRVHQLVYRMSTLVKSRSSWGEYIKEVGKGFCEKRIILEQFKNKADYKTFAQDSLESTLERKADLKEMERYLLE